MSAVVSEICLCVCASCADCYATQWDVHAAACPHVNAGAIARSQSCMDSDKMRSARACRRRIKNVHVSADADGRRDATRYVTPNRPSRCAQGWMLSQQVMTVISRLHVDSTLPRPPSPGVVNNRPMMIACLWHSATVGMPWPIFFPNIEFEKKSRREIPLFWRYPNFIVTLSQGKARCQKSWIRSTVLTQYRRVTYRRRHGPIASA